MQTRLRDSDDGGTSLARTAMRRLRIFRRDEGIALIAALGMLLVLGVASTTVVYYSSTNTRSASLSASETTAFQLAEAGIAEAMSVLSNTHVNNPMSTTLLSERTSTYAGGTVTWSGTLSQPTATWSLTSTGNVTNPSGAGTVHRRLTATATVVPHYTETQENGAWDYVFVTGTGQICDMTLSANFTWDSNLYVMGNLCLGNGARITGGELVVRQRLDLGTSTTTVGTSVAPLAKAQIGSGCQYANQHWHPDASHPTHPFCSSVDNVWASQLDQNPPVIPPPVPEWDTWYQNAIPGPSYPCTYSSGTPPAFDNNTTRDFNGSIAGEFDLTPVTGYSCRVGPASAPIGEITWDPTQNPKKLTIRGTIYIDGSVVVSGAGPYEYDGHGTLYLSGTFRVAGGKMCTRVSGSDCDYAGWNPNSEMMTIVAGGNLLAGGIESVSLASGARYQGAIYSAYQMELAANAKHEGPLVAPSLQLGAGAVTDPWNVVGTVPTGTPGETPQYSDVSPPKDYSG